MEVKDIRVGAGDLFRDDAYKLAAGLFMERHPAVGSGEEGVVSSAAYQTAGVDLRSTLTDENRSCGDDLTTKDFYTQPLGC